MGIDFVIIIPTYESVDARWSAAYFHDFRRRLAAEVGIDLERMDGYGGELQWSHADPIELFLDRPDVLGELNCIECAEVAPRLRELVAGWPDDDDDKKSALGLAAGMERVAELGGNDVAQTVLKFC